MFDLFVTHLLGEDHILWKQGPRGQFLDRTTEVGLNSRFWRGVGWGTVLADFNQDGFLDLALVNGYVHHRGDPFPNTGSFWAEFEDRNQLFTNDGKGHFRDISLQNAPFCKPTAIGRGLICGDIDGDGSLDLVTTCIGGRARVYRNVAPQRGHWLMIRAVDPSLGGRDAYGAEVTVIASGHRWLRLINPGYSYLSSHDPRAHFGLGAITQIETIHVLWPDGKAEDFPAPAVDQSLVLRKGSGRP
jgi:hypothetical protein